MRTIRIYFLKIIYYDFWLCWVFIAACSLPLVAVSRGYSPVVLLGFFTVVASLIGHRL